MKIIVRPVVEPQREIDLTHRLVSAIAGELWRLYGGNDQLNWLEAENHLERLLGEARAEARETTFVSVGRAARAAGFRKVGEAGHGAEELGRQRGAASSEMSRRRAGRVPVRGSPTGGDRAGSGSAIVAR